MSVRSAHSSGPAKGGAAVTPHDTNDLTIPARSLWIGGAGGGALSVIMKSGETVAFAGIPAGTLLPIQVTRVRSTGTSVTSIVALY